MVVHAERSLVNRLNNTRGMSVNNLIQNSSSFLIACLLKMVARKRKPAVYYYNKNQNILLQLTPRTLLSFVIAQWDEDDGC